MSQRGRTGRRSLVVAAVVTAALALAGCGGGGTPRGSAPTPGSSNGGGLPPIAVAPCPTADELLAPGARPDSGTLLPDVTVRCIEPAGRQVALRAVGGVPTVVNLWASWCEPCKREMPGMQRVFHAAAGRVRFLGVNVADYDETSARGAIQLTGVGYPQTIVDGSGGRRLLDQVRAPGPPATFFVGADGRVLGRDGELTEDELRERIRELFGITL